ncbi:helix-turn-helix domain-containing protein [Alteribacillus bidgolensis]|uniref:Transcriptional regulator, XRE family with cupin sensor n=1 Tax=Alteribacillus bidgolensis TaxID=930129 RepID=A0A1G8KXG3_9BACI|nr:XRE family transcriptional regulator [Alteribacillus bidgolensis]SDI48043.1 transcriptional regulator, XRE family with cupin sensor [Alteribacillus bidgolensis]
MSNAETLAKQVGSTLRKIRQERGMSLQELADRIEVSKLTLGKIERGEANPSLTVIWKIANGLSIPISVLLSEEQHVKISRKNTGNKVVSANEACTLEPMFNVSHYGSIEMHRAYLKPNSEYFPGSHQSGVVEYVTVMEGEVKINIEGEMFYLNQHDSIKFNGDREHAYINSTASTAVLHFVMTYANA